MQVTHLITEAFILYIEDDLDSVSGRTVGLSPT
jgi:hypothetical protein